MVFLLLLLLVYVFMVLYKTSTNVNRSPVRTAVSALTGSTSTGAIANRAGREPTVNKVNEISRGHSATHLNIEGIGSVVKHLTAEPGIASSIPDPLTLTRITKKEICTFFPRKNAPMYQCFTRGTLKKLVCHVWFGAPISCTMDH